MFSINELSKHDIEQMCTAGVWNDQCPVSLAALRRVDIEHYNFENKLRKGQIIVHNKIAHAILSIFRKLAEIKFPIHSMKPIHSYNGDDNLSMEDNNSSGFNFRNILNSDLISLHSYGLAIDINPLQNPFIIIHDNQSVEIFPKQGVGFLNRNNQRKGMVEPVIELFKEYGFEWGGNWNSPIDYHHFQIPRKLAAKFLIDEETLNAENNILRS